MPLTHKPNGLDNPVRATVRADVPSSSGSDPLEARTMTRIRTAREKAKLSQEDMAHQVGVSTRTWCRWERQEGGGWQRYIDRIADVLNVSREQLLGNEYVEPVTMDDVMESLAKLTAEVERLSRNLAEAQQITATSRAGKLAKLAQSNGKFDPALL